MSNPGTKKYTILENLQTFVTEKEATLKLLYQANTSLIEKDQIASSHMVEDQETFIDSQFKSNINRNKLAKENCLKAVKEMTPPKNNP